ncbi:MAG: LCP family protein [Negativicutes bacterium]
MVLAFFAAVGAGAFLASTSLFDAPRRLARLDRANETLLVATDKTTVMILGVDERDDDVGRSDTLMLATVDPKQKQVSLLSIPRDTRTLIQGSYDKINSAYAYGGWKLTRDVVEDLLDTPVDHYVLVNTRSFPRIIDAIGGIDLYVESRMYYVDEWDDAVPGGLVIDLYPGMQHMDGVTAMSYVRYRDEEGDIGRIARQQRFMRAVMEKVTSPAIVTRLPAVIRECMGAVETDLSFRQILELAGSIKEAQGNGLRAEMLPGRPLYIDEVSYWVPDLTETRTRLASTLGITMSQKARAEMEREQREYEASIPSTAREVPPGDTSLGRPDRRSGGASASSAAGRTSPSGTGPLRGSGAASSRSAEDTAGTERSESEDNSSGNSSAVRPSWANPEGSGPRPGTDLSRTPPGDSDDEASAGPITPEAPARPVAPSAPAAPSMTNSGKGR